MGIAALPGFVFAQSAVDGLRFSQTDIRGTARYMAMGGAFTALGGDLSAISLNPGGIGIYRTQEVGFSVNLNAQDSKATSQGFSNSEKGTKFQLNNIGGVATWRLPSEACPNLNFGFTFNRGATFNRKYIGRVPQLSNSMSNYIAGVSNAGNVLESEVDGSGSDMWNNGVPWLSILGNESLLIYPIYDSDDQIVPHWVGQWNSRTSGSGTFAANESGCVNEYNLVIGGNIYDVLYWGMDFDITSFNFTQDTWWQEDLTDAAIPGETIGGTDSEILPGPSNWSLHNYYNASANGFNYKFGIILKPIQELRVGLAFHTPTWYSVNEVFSADVTSKYGNETAPTVKYTNDGYNGSNSYNFRTPWRFNFGLAGVIANRLILSADYELMPCSQIHFSTYDNYYDNYGYGWDDPYYWDFSSEPTRSMSDSDYNFSNDPYANENGDVKRYFQTSNTVKFGAEFRVLPQFSVRAGYAYNSSPIKKEVLDNKMQVYTAGTSASYVLSRDTQYLSFGLGYRYKAFYADLAYQFKHQEADYHAYTPDPSNPDIPSPQARMSFNDHNVVLSCGFKF